MLLIRDTPKLTNKLTTMNEAILLYCIMLDKDDNL